MTPYEAIRKVADTHESLTKSQAALDHVSNAVVVAQETVTRAAAAHKAAHLEAAQVLVPHRLYSLEPDPKPVFTLGQDGEVHKVVPEVLATPATAPKPAEPAK